MSKLDGKIVLISGGTSGIGAACAALFRSEGATVIVTCSNHASAIAADIPGVETIASDAANVVAVKALIAQVVARHDRIDILFANAGIDRFASLADVDEAFFDEHFNLNVRGVYFLIKYATPHIPDGGSIIITGAVTGSNGGSPGASIYGATKAAVRSFGRTLARELAPRGIRVNTVSPGPIDTPIFDKIGFTSARKGAFLTAVKARIPMGRIGKAEEVARAVVYLAADATYTTGAELFVDGGLIDV